MLPASDRYGTTPYNITVSGIWEYRWYSRLGGVTVISDRPALHGDRRRLRLSTYG